MCFPVPQRQAHDNPITLHIILLKLPDIWIFKPDITGLIQCNQKAAYVCIISFNIIGFNSHIYTFIFKKGVFHGKDNTTAKNNKPCA